MPMNRPRVPPRADTKSATSQFGIWDWCVYFNSSKNTRKYRMVSLTSCQVLFGCLSFKNSFFPQSILYFIRRTIVTHLYTFPVDCVVACLRTLFHYLCIKIVCLIYDMIIHISQALVKFALTTWLQTSHFPLCWYWTVTSTGLFSSVVQAEARLSIIVAIVWIDDSLDKFQVP